MGRRTLWGTFQARIRPRVRIQPLKFGAEHRTYSKEGKSARWKPEETPWAAGILHTLSDESPKRRIVCPKGTQLGFTEIGLIWVGQGILEAISALVIEPTEAVAKRVVKTKFRPMLTTTTILRGVFGGRSADTTLHFSSPFCDVIFGGSNSPTNFASTTVQRTMGDEVDRWSEELLKEGDPVDLLENRIAEYGFLGKMFLPSSPTVEGASIVWREWLQSDQRVFKCPCPECGFKQQWLWEQMHWDAGKPETARLQCTECGVLSPELAWKTAWSEGDWVITNPDPIRKDSAGFHLSTLYARFGQRSWAQLVQQFEAVMASGLPSRIQTFWNTVLGLPWKISEESIEVDALRNRLEAGPIRGEVPAGGLMLTAGTDYQKTYLETTVWAWARRMERWPVDKIVIPLVNADGSKRPSKAIAEDYRREVAERDWQHALGGKLKVELSLHDTSNLPADVFDILDHLSSTRNIGVKGLEGWGQKILFRPPKIVDVRRDGKVVKFGRKLMNTHTAEAKREFYEDLRRPLAEDGPSERYVHLPEWLEEEKGYLEGLVSEEIRKTQRGKPQWVKIVERNEPLDCAILARGAHWQLKAHRWSDAEWARREAMVSTERKPTPSTPPPPGGGGRSRVRGRMG